MITFSVCLSLLILAFIAAIFSQQHNDWVLNRDRHLYVPTFFQSEGFYRAFLINVSFAGISTAAGNAMQVRDKQVTPDRGRLGMRPWLETERAKPCSAERLLGPHSSQRTKRTGPLPLRGWPQALEQRPQCSLLVLPAGHRAFINGLAHLADAGRPHRLLALVERQAGRLPIQAAPAHQSSRHTFRVAHRLLIVHFQHRHRQHVPPVVHDAQKLP